MSDPSPFGANGLTENQAPATGFRILGQFVRDFSFENPRAPESFRIETKPEVDLGVEMSARGREDGVYEVDLKLNVTATSNGLPMFAVELVYGGLFQIQGVAEAMIEPLLLIEAPRFMFPFARRIIADATADGGFFPPFQLDPIDFETVYMTQKAQMSQQAAGQA